MSDGTLADLVEQVAAKAVGQKPSAARYVGLEHIESSTRRLSGTAPASVSDSTNNVFQSGDILFGKLRPNLRKAVQVDFDGFCSTDIIVMRAKPGVHRGYAAHAASSDQVFRHAERNSIGTGMPRTSWGAVAKAPVSVPPLEEQRRIAEILDAVDETIEATERVIAKLTIARRGLVTDLLRPESDWLEASVGERLLRIESGKSPDAPDRRPGDGEWGVLKVSAVHPAGFRPSESKVLSSDQVRTHDEVKPGDVLITRANTPELVGMCCFVESTPPHRQLSDKTLRLVPAPSVIPRFLVLTLQSPGIRRQIERDGTGSSGSMKNISQAEIKGLRASWPPIERQISITETVQAVDSRLTEEAIVLSKLRGARAGVADDLFSGRVRRVAA